MSEREKAFVAVILGYISGAHEHLQELPQTPEMIAAEQHLEAAFEYLEEVLLS